MKYTNSEIVKRIEKAQKNQKYLTHITDKLHLSTEDKMKLSLCKHFIQFANNNRLKLKEIAKMTEIPITRLSEITNYKISKFTVDQLIKNLSILAKNDPPLREYLVFLEQAVEMPTLKVMETKKLTKNLKKVQKSWNEHASVHT